VSRAATVPRAALEYFHGKTSLGGSGVDHSGHNYSGPDPGQPRGLPGKVGSPVGLFATHKNDPGPLPLSEEINLPLAVAFAVCLVFFGANEHGEVPEAWSKAVSGPGAGPRSQRAPARR
jgi:hypothetical protein